MTREQILAELSDADRLAVLENERRAMVDTRYLDAFADVDQEAVQDEILLHVQWFETAKCFANFRREAADLALTEALAAHAKLETALAELNESLDLVDDAARLRTGTR